MILGGIDVADEEDDCKKASIDIRHDIQSEERIGALDNNDLCHVDVLAMISSSTSMVEEW
jgi:hypothetical protein